MSAIAVFNAFIGKWAIKRDIRDCLNNLSASVSGVAEFCKSAANPNELVYSEEVSVKWSNQSEAHKAAKLYKYQLNGDSLTKFDSVVKADKAVEFEKMFDLTFSQRGSSGRLSASGSFLCGPDTYNAEYSIEPNMDRFTLIYLAKGTSKHFITTTMFTKM